MRRLIVLVPLVLALIAGQVAAVAAQQATPQPGGDSALARMGFPELRIQVTDDDIIAPGEVPAGRTLIVYENAGQESRLSFLMKLPDTWTIGDLITAPVDEEGTPLWFFEGTFVGFPIEVAAGETQRAVVDLTPGIYVIFDDFTELFVAVPGPEAAGGTPAPADAPAADGTVRLFDYNFEMPDSITAGTHVWEFVNDGPEVHQVLLLRSPVPMTVEQVMALLEMGSEEATPPGGGPSFADLEPAGGMSRLSPGLRAWAEVTLEAGHYVAICFVFSPDTGMPHAFLGMVNVFSVD